MLPLPRAHWEEDLRSAALSRALCVSGFWEWAGGDLGLADSSAGRGREGQRHPQKEAGLPLPPALSGTDPSSPPTVTLSLGLGLPAA